MELIEPVAITIPRRIYNQLVDYCRNPRADMRRIACEMIAEGLQNPVCLMPGHSVPEENTQLAALCIWVTGEIAKNLRETVEGLGGRTMDRVVSRYIEPGLEECGNRPATHPVLPTSMCEVLDRHYTHLASGSTLKPLAKAKRKRVQRVNLFSCPYPGISMIGKLSGRLDSVSGSHIIVDVSGVGYVVTCSARTLRNIGAVGEAVTLRIETHVREDAISLYGFADTVEQDWFKLLTTVQGVGAKVGLAILGSLSPEQLIQAIASQDKTAMTQADGVGPKLALRLVTELKDKVPSFMASTVRVAASGAETPLPRSAAGDALSALMNLGYRRGEAYAVVASVSQQNPVAKLDEIIRLSLAELSRKDSAA